jgi:hypothetical protein
MFLEAIPVVPLEVLQAVFPQVLLSVEVLPGPEVVLHKP